MFIYNYLVRQTRTLVTNSLCHMILDEYREQSRRGLIQTALLLIYIVALRSNKYETMIQSTVVGRSMSAISAVFNVIIQLYMEFPQSLVHL